MMRFIQWAVLPVVAGAALFFAAPAQAQGVSIGVYGQNGGLFYSNAPVVQPYPYYVAPRVYVPVAPRPYPVYAPYPYPYPRYYGGYRGPYHHHHHHH